MSASVLDLMAWLPDSPFRRLDRRWLRAQDLHARGKRRGRFDDPWIGAARETIKGRKRTKQITAIRAAQAIWEAPDRQPAWEIEARILAAQNDEDIAKAMNLPAAVIDAYEHVFFDVRRSLRARDWIMLYAVGGLAFTNFAGAEQPATSWRYVAYIGGAVALEIVLALCRETPLPPGTIRSEGEQAIRDEARLRLKVKAWLQLLVAKTPTEVEEAIRIYELANSQASDSVVGQSEGGFVSVMSQFLQTVLPSTGRKQPNATTQADAKRNSSKKSTKSACRPAPVENVNECSEKRNEKDARHEKPGGLAAEGEPVSAPRRRTVRVIPVDGATDEPAATEHAAPQESEDCVRSGNDWQSILLGDAAQRAERPLRLTD